MKVLLATDGLDPASAALQVIAAIGNRRHVEITTLTVAEHGDPPEADRTRAEQVAEKAAEDARRAGFRASARAVVGEPGARIVEEARAGRYDLVCVGGGQTSWLGNLLLGSVSTHVLHASTTSVLVVHRPPSTARLPSIVVAVDGSDAGWAAPGTLAALADPSLCRVHVVSAARQIVPDLITRSEGEDDDGLQQRAVANAEAAVKRAEDLLAARGFRTSAEVVVGQATRQILGAAEACRADLVVLGASGSSTLRRVLLGSTSQQIARLAPATLVARPTRSFRRAALRIRSGMFSPATS